MPRNHNPGTLRNRNRITNKTRLKVIHGNIDADPLVLEEDEEKARVVSTAGVDAEDANEHHLQAVLSAASQRHHPSSIRTSRGAAAGKPVAAEAYIPIPDSTGVVDDFAKLYPADRWRDPTTYVRASDTVDDAIDGALPDGFTYYMDERDHEWLAKNNEAARGEGTSAQGSISTSGTSTRSGTNRSAKSKGKEPDVSQATAMTEDEFELLMGVFEKVTHEKTEFLHHSLETGMAFPPFADYQEVFATALPISTFAAFTPPSWIPPPAQLARLAQAIYPYWRERRIERGGHRIIPALNYDESDVKNESYICFRRREVKTVRKTRAQQVSYSDKLLRLQAEFSVALELALNVETRETSKIEANTLAQEVWSQRLLMVDLKRKSSALGTKEDEELFFDKERAIKKPKPDLPRPITIRPGATTLATPSAIEPPIRPRERFAQIQAHVERDLARQKEKDQNWEDGIDNPYQLRPVPYPERLYKYIPSSRPSSSDSGKSSGDTEHVREPHALRLRVGRGGRVHVDRRRPPRPSTRANEAASDAFSDDDAERRRRVRELWMFDEDDAPSMGPEGQEEHDRVLFDDYQTKHLVHSITLLRSADHDSLNTDASLHLTSSDGRARSIIPSSIKFVQQLALRHNHRPAAPVMGPPAPVTVLQPQAGPTSAVVPPATNGTVVSTLKKLQPPSLGQTRIASNGAMRPVPSLGSLPPGLHPPPPSLTVLAPHAGNGSSASSPSKSPVNGKGSLPNGAMENGTILAPVTAEEAVVQGSSPVLPKSPVKHHMVVPNSYQMGTVNGYPPPMTNATAYVTQANGLGTHHMQEMKATYPTMPDMQLNGRPGYPTHVVQTGANFQVPLGGSTFNLKPPPTRQQWSATRPPSSAGGDTSAPNGGSPGMAHAHAAMVMSNQGTPVRVPSANGMRAMTPSVAQMMAATPRGASPAQNALLAAQYAAHAQAMASHLHPAGSPLPAGAHSLQGSPPRPAASPIPPSPSLQSVLPSGSAGY